MKTAPTPCVNKKVGIWIRVSTEDQAQGDSPAHHEARAREYAKLYGWDVAEVYDLAGVSGKSVMEHPEAKRMMADVRRGHITALIFSKLARLARNTKELLDFSDFFRAKGADMVSLQERIDTSTPAGRLFYTMIAAMAEWEREEIGDRVRASIGVRAKLGKPLNGSSPYGYRWRRPQLAGAPDGTTDDRAPKTLTVEPGEAVIVKRLFELFLQHRRKGTVARLLNAAGYRTRMGTLWNDMGVGRVLVQTCVKGTYVYNATRRTGNWQSVEKPEDQWSRLSVEPIVSEDLWLQVNQILETQEKKPARVGKTPVRPFAGLTVCQCGHKMYIPSGSRKYTCIKCKNKILADDLDSIFHAELKAYFVAPERIAAHLEKAKQGISEKEERASAHRREIQKVRDEMARTHQLYLAGQIPLESFGSYHKPMEERLKQLQTELPRLEAELAHHHVRDLSADAVLREATALYARWPSLASDEKQRIIQSVTEKITVGTDEIEISLSYLPSSEELTKSQQLVCQARSLALATG